MYQKPKIGITAPSSGKDFFWWSLAIAVWLQGGRPVLLSPLGKNSLDGLAGLMLSGGNDIDPRNYQIKPLPIGGREETRKGEKIKARKRPQPERDALEFALIREAINLDLPVLGVCRGLQVINVALGGTLHSDIGAFYSGQKIPRSAFPVKQITVRKDTPLFYVLGEGPMRVNALHSQGIDQLAPGLDAIACEDNGLVQAIWLSSANFFVGVQWHPELLWYQARQRKLFKTFLAAAKRKRPLQEQ